jgi:DNA-binding MarR family transcriptional regulator
MLSNKEYVQINQALFSLTHAYESRMAKDERAIQGGLALSDCSVIMVMGQLQPMNSNQLSKAMDINPGTISVYVQRLVEKGMVCRERDKEDRRNWWLTLTEAGETAFQMVRDGTVEYTGDFLAVLDDQEQRTLLQLLLRASHNLGFNWQ